MFTRITRYIAYSPGHKPQPRGSRHRPGAVPAHAVKGTEADTAPTHR